MEVRSEPAHSHDVSKHTAILGRLATRIGNRGRLQDLCAFIYDEVHDEFGLVSFSVAQSDPRTGRLRDLLVMGEDMARPVGRGRTPRTSGPFGQGTRFSVTMHAGEREVGQLTVGTANKREWTAEESRFLLTIADLLGVALDRDLSETAAAQRESELRILFDGSRQIAAGLTPAEMLGALAECLQQLTGVDLVIVSRCELEQGYAVPEAYYAVPGTWVADLARAFPLGNDSAAEKAIRMQQPIIGEGDVPSGADGRWTHEAGWYAYAILPLVLADQTWGLAEMASRKPGFRFAVRDLEYCRAALHFAATSLAARRHVNNPAIKAADDEGLRLADALSTISASIDADLAPHALYTVILKQARTLLPFDDAAIALLEDGQLVVSAALGPAFQNLPATVSMAWLWRNAQNLDRDACRHEPDFDRQLRLVGISDLTSMPIVLHADVVGRLIFGSRAPRLYTEQQVRIVGILAERTAQVLRMVQLRNAQEETTARLTQLEATRQDFVATVSHELRTPLTGILGYLELLLSRWTSLEDERRLSMLQRTQSAATRLQHLVSDLLLFSNVEHQELQLHPNRYTMTTLVEQAVDDIVTKYRGQRIVLHGKDNAARVWADAQRAIQVLINLLDNAVKYSGTGSTVTVEWVTVDAMVEMAIHDEGPGIRTEDLPRLFVRFSTLGHQPRPGQAGTGIGLYICKKLIESMHGRIWVESEPGKGSTFRFTLPRAPD